MASVQCNCRVELPVVLLSMHLGCLANPNDGSMTLDYACDFSIQGSRRFYLISFRFSSLTHT
jgi:hypothetical protein